VVLYNHPVLGTQIERFIRQLDYGSQKYSFISLGYLDILPSKKNLNSFAFNDGLLSILINVLPELQKREI
jgi:hypothetical protein